MLVAFHRVCAVANATKNDLELKMCIFHPVSRLEIGVRYIIIVKIHLNIPKIFKFCNTPKHLSKENHYNYNYNK